MPLTIQGDGYRDFSEPRFFECETTAQVRQIFMPVNKSHALVGATNGSTNLAVWKFDSASVAAASSTVLVPDNPAYTTVGRWISIPVGGSSGGSSQMLQGSDDPPTAIGNPPSDPTQPATYTIDSGANKGVAYTWLVNDQDWF